MHDSAAKRISQTSLRVPTLEFLPLFGHILVGHFVPCEDQNGHRPDHQGQVEQIKGYTEACQQQGETERGNAPGQGHDEEEGVVEGAQEKGRGREEEPDQHGEQPGVDRQRRQEERDRCLTH